ncbi:MAG: hypothetical protein K9G70_02655 [Prolixibacteraceae bacterium]|nr:hypothetical protein [Prolixibacteraceae bacterium]
MKRKSNLQKLTFIVLSLIIGFVIGISVNFPKTNTDNLRGTIGKVNKHRNVNITDADIQLRSELIDDNQKREGYLNYYTFHYSTVTQLSALVDTAITTAVQNTDFAQGNPQVINSLKTYRKNIENPRAELLLAVLTLQNIDEVEEASISTILNMANMAVQRLTYNENAIANFTFAAQEYITKNRNADIDDLIAVHDNLSMLQFSKAVITKDKPMIKYYDKHEIFSDSENLSGMAASIETLKGIFFFDTELLKTGFTDQSQLEGSEKLYSTGAFSNEILGSSFPPFLFDAQKLENAEALMGKILFDIEKLGIHSNTVLGSQINGNLNSEELLSLWDSEQLQAGMIILDSEQLGNRSGQF